MAGEDRSGKRKRNIATDRQTEIDEMRERERRGREIDKKK